jgi:hypothetical protein
MHVYLNVLAATHVYSAGLDMHVAVSIIPYPHERGPITERQPTPHFWLNFLIRSNVYSNMRPCVAALEKRRSNGGFMRTELQTI